MISFILQIPFMDVIINNKGANMDNIDTDITAIRLRLDRLDREESKAKLDWHLINVLFAEMHSTSIQCFLWK